MHGPCSVGHVVSVVVPRDLYAALVAARLEIEQSLPDAYALAGESMACNMLDPDAAEGIDAFFGKRAPQWRVQ